MFSNMIFILRLAAFTLLLGLYSPSLANAQLSRMQSGELIYTLQGTGPDFKLLIKPSNGVSNLSRNLTANVFSVKSPSRLVIDLPGFGKGRSKSVSLANSFLSGLRLGIHSDKTRVVLDIKDNRIPVYDVSADPDLGALVVSFAVSSSPRPASRPATPMKTPKMIPSKAPKVKTEFPPDLTQTSKATSIGGTRVPIQKTVSDPIPLPKVEVEKTASPRPTIKKPLEDRKPQYSDKTFVLKGNEPQQKAIPEIPQMTKQVKQAAEPELPKPGSQTLVQGILFQAPKDAPLGALVVDGKKLDQYSLNQKGPNLFELIIKNATLDGQHLTLPQFPPESFKGFEVILSNQVDADVVIKIYVNDGVKLAPYMAQGKLWVKASQ